MNIRVVAAGLVVSWCVASTAGAQQSAAPAHPHTHGVSSYTIETAPVEEVLRTDDDGFDAVTYVVTWKGSRVGVEDPL